MNESNESDQWRKSLLQLLNSHQGCNSMKMKNAEDLKRIWTVQSLLLNPN